MNLNQPVRLVSQISGAVLTRPESFSFFFFVFVVGLVVVKMSMMRMMLFRPVLAPSMGGVSGRWYTDRFLFFPLSYPPFVSFFLLIFIAETFPTKGRTSLCTEGLFTKQNCPIEKMEKMELN